MTAATFTAKRDGDSIHMAGNLWSDTFTVADADRRLAFYDRMAKQYPGQAYTQAATALREAIKAKEDAGND